MQRFQVRGEYITLGQLLKVMGLIGTGGEVKSFLADAAITVNEEAENRRGRKLRPGDVVVLEGVEAITLYGEDEPDEDGPEVEAPPVGPGWGATAGPAESDLAKQWIPNQETAEPRIHIKKSVSKRRVKPRRS